MLLEFLSLTFEDVSHLVQLLVVGVDLVGEFVDVVGSLGGSRVDGCENGSKRGVWSRLSSGSRSSRKVLPRWCLPSGAGGASLRRGRSAIALWHRVV
jgi:hypothetical protein